MIKKLEWIIRVTALMFYTAGYSAAVIPAEDREELLVRLNTEAVLTPVYIAKFHNDNAGFDQNYLDQLEQILVFDFKNNGLSVLVDRERGKSLIPDQVSFNTMGDPAEWKKRSVHHVIRIQVKNKSLSARLLAVKTKEYKSIPGLALIGDISKDRKLVHQLADALHYEMYGTDGVASTRVLYVVKSRNESKKWSSDIWQADYDGANARRITSDGGYCMTPAYLPPKASGVSGSFFCVSYQKGQPKIYLGLLDDGIIRRLTYMRGNQLMPAVSPKRDRIAFINDFTGNPELFLLQFDPEKGPIGNPRQIFSAPHAVQSSPAFSPDGSSLAFVSSKDGSPRIYTMKIPDLGTPLKDVKAALISRQNRESTAPTWSPDGLKLAYSSMKEGIRQIWIYDFNKNQEIQLTQGPGNKENPTWAPNSLHLIFNSTGPSGNELYLINLNQPKAVKITSGPGDKRFPNWEPKPL